MTELELRGVSVVRGRRDVVHSVSLMLRAGELWGLLGPNGAGKSTLLEALIGALPLAAGSVCLNGTALLELTPRERARRLTMLGADLSFGLGLSARDLVELGRLPYLSAFGGLGSRDRAAVELALERADVTSFAGRPLSSLSDGERQRVHFARALAQEPEVLLMDEATAHFDAVHRERALTAVREFTRAGKSAFAVLHDLDLAARYCTHVAILVRGRLVAYGPTERVLERELLERVFEIRAELACDGHGRSLRIFGPSERSLADHFSART